MDEIRRISSWNLPDFIKFIWFHEICRISWYTTECCIFHQNQYSMSLLHTKYAVYKSLPWNPPDFMHEIHWISWNLVGFMVYHWMLFFFYQNQYRYTLLAHLGCKNANLHGLPLNPVYICSVYKSLPWNPPYFMKSAGFHLTMKSGGFHAKWAKDQWSYFSHKLWEIIDKSVR